MNTPYTYYLEWSTGMKYYGVRYAKSCHPNDLWNPYKTSSEYVANYIIEHGDPIKKEIRKEFLGEDSVSSAIEWEHKVLRRLNAAYRQDFLNKRDSKGINYSDPAVAEKRNTNMKRTLNTPESKEKRRIVDSLPITKENRSIAAKKRESDPVKKAHRLSRAFCDEAITKRKNNHKITVNTLEYKEKRSKISSEINSRPEILENNKEKNSGLKNSRAIITPVLFRNKVTNEEKYLTCYEMTQYLRSIGIRYGHASTLFRHPNKSLGYWQAIK
jgi:hypothetical protein